MKVGTWKKLLTVFLASGMLGAVLWLYNWILSVLLLLVSAVGMLILFQKRYGGDSWLSFPEVPKLRKLPSWLILWIVSSFCAFLLAAYIVDSNPFLRLLLLFFFIESVFLWMLYLYVIRD